MCDVSLDEVFLHLRGGGTSARSSPRLSLVAGLAGSGHPYLHASVYYYGADPTEAKVYH